MRDSTALILAIDQGTSATKALVVDGVGRPVANATRPLTQQYPRPGWVEQSPEHIFDSIRAVVGEVLSQLDAPIAAIGLSSQRESVLAWERRTGRPLSPVLGWQDRRTAAAAAHFAADAAEIRRRTGLPVDPMFSALKLSWLLREGELPAQDIVLGTVDAWLVARLTGEARIEIGNASRTQLMNIDTGGWDERLLDLFGVPAHALPEICDSDAATRPVCGVEGLDGVQITGILGDSHAALYGHGVRAPGQVKVTYGTGSSIMGLLAECAGAGASLARTVAWRTQGATAMAFEGNILSAGATVSWLASLLGIPVSEVWDLAQSADGTSSVQLVPAFAGLGAPWWDKHADAAITGLALGTTRADLAEAAASSICLQIEDVLSAVDVASGGRIHHVFADGGPSANDWLMRLQADLSQRSVHPAAIAELSAFGAARLAAGTAGIGAVDPSSWPSPHRAVVSPQRSADWTRSRRRDWLSAVSRSRLRTANAVTSEAGHTSSCGTDG